MHPKVSTSGFGGFGGIIGFSEYFHLATFSERGPVRGGGRERPRLDFRQLELIPKPASCWKKKKKKKEMINYNL
jgi:hypothetical protein